MKLCIPVDRAAGLDSTLAGTFGGAPALLIVDNVSLEQEVIDCDDGACRAAPIVIDAVLCRGIGPNLFARLSAQGIPIYGTRMDTVATALEEFNSGLAFRFEGGACGCSGASAGCGSGGGGCGGGNSGGGCGSGGCGSH